METQTVQVTFSDRLPVGGVLKCTLCKRKEEIVSLSQYMRDHWVECCGKSMIYTTTVQESFDDEQDPDDERDPDDSDEDLQ